MKETLFKFRTTSNAMGLYSRLKKEFNSSFADRPNILKSIMDVMDYIVAGQVYESEVDNNLLPDVFKKVYEEPYDMLYHMSIAFGVPVSVITKKGRLRTQVSIRQYFCYQCKLVFGSMYSFKKIGELLSNQDHTTIIHAMNKCIDRLETRDTLMIHLQEKWIAYNLKNQTNVNA